ncbi:MAG: hypothetical protein ACXWAT_00550 [Methylobacter sp.]
MNEENESSFDLDAGVADIAASMGFDADADDGQDDDTGLEDSHEEDQADDNEDPEEKPEEKSPVATTKQPPASWSKDKHEVWGSLTPDAQEYIEHREKQMLDGIEQYKQGHQYAQDMQRTIAPYMESMQRFNVQPQQAIQNLFNAHIALTEGSIESRQQTFIKLGQDIGLIPKDGQQQIDPYTQQLQERLDRIERAEQDRARQQQEQTYNKVAADVEAFAADPEHVYFDEVADDMLPFLKPGMTIAELKTVYDKAVWANPITRAKELAKEQQKASSLSSDKSRQEAEKAKKAASVNVRPSRGKRVEAPIGSWENTMEETLRAIKNR